MPSHRCHELIGRLLGLDLSAVKLANYIIDFPGEYLRSPFREMEIGHDDGRKWAMDFIRKYLSQFHGPNGVLAADLHYALDYIECWLDPEKVRKMLEAMKAETLYPPERKGFADPDRRLWYSYPASGRLPIIAYCKKCKGKKRLINSPFCDKCQVNLLSLEKPEGISLGNVTLMFNRFAEERELDQKIRRFIVGNMVLIVDKIVEDRKQRGLNSLKVF